MTRRKKRREFSKIIMAVVGTVTIVVTVFTLAFVWKTGDASPLAYLILAVFAELATATGFYYSNDVYKRQKVYQWEPEEIISGLRIKTKVRFTFFRWPTS